VYFRSTEFVETNADQLRSEQWNFILWIETIIWSVWFSETKFVYNSQDELKMGSKIILCEIKTFFGACYSVRLYSWILLLMNWEMSSKFYCVNWNLYLETRDTLWLNSWKNGGWAEKWAVKSHSVNLRLYLVRLIQCDRIRVNNCRSTEKWALKFHSVNWRLYLGNTVDELKSAQCNILLNWRL
jgi:hypothetical protein